MSLAIRRDVARSQKFIMGPPNREYNMSHHVMRYNQNSIGHTHVFKDGELKDFTMSTAIN